MKHEIEIEGLPEGWEPVAFRVPVKGDSIISFSGELQRVPGSYTQPRLIVKKKQPRRIVLEETEEENLKVGNAYQYQCPVDYLTLYNQPKIWREVKETDLSLHNADDKESLRLSVDDARDLLHYIPSGTEFHKKIVDFIWAKK